MGRGKQLLLNVLVTTLTVAFVYGVWRASVQWRRVDAMWAWVNQHQAQHMTPPPADKK